MWFFKPHVGKGFDQGLPGDFKTFGNGHRMGSVLKKARSYQSRVPI